jgi:hypothetical protein
LVDGTQWLNETAADLEVSNGLGDTNSVVEL